MKHSQKTSKIYKELLNKKSDKIQLLSSIKHLDYFKTQKKLRQAIKHPIAKKIIIAEPLPKSYQDLRNNKKSFFTKNLGGELAWVVEGIIRYSKEINHFVKLEKEFEESILHEKYEISNKILSRVEQEICFSFWGLENRYSVIEKLDDTESNWRFLNETNKQFLNNGMNTLFNEMFSKKVETNFSVIQYKRELENITSRLDEVGSEYILFKLGYLFWNDYKHFPFIIYFDSNSSIIDRYLGLIEILVELISNEDNEIFQRLAKTIIQDIGHLIEDERMDRLKELIGEKKFESLDVDILHIIDDYSRGELRKCIDKIPKQLVVNPCFVELYEIYIISLIQLKLEFQPTNVSGLIDGILENMYNLYLRGERFSDSNEVILKIIISFQHCKFSKQLLGMIASSIGLKSKRSIFLLNFFINSGFSNPIGFHCTSNEISISQIEDPLNDYLCFKINYGISFNKPEFYLKEKDIPEKKKDLYEARRLFKNKNFQGVISIWDRLKFDIETKGLLEEEFNFLSFFSYLFDFKLNNAVSLYVNTYMSNKNLINQFDGELLWNTIEQKNYEVFGSIDLPIFFRLMDSDSYHIYIALDIFLIEQKVEFPSDLDQSKFDLKKLVFLLNEVCTPDILDKFYLQYETSEDVREQRRSILRKLIKVDKEQQNNYLNEIAKINQKEKIKGILSRVNRGKIKLNIDKVKKSQEFNLEDSYIRFKKLNTYTENYDFKTLDVDSLIESYINEINTSPSKLSDASFLAFKLLIYEVIDYLVYDKKYGLDGDLSMKIRHGVLENHLRSVFERHNLISKKNEKSEYLDLNFWKKIENNIPEKDSSKFQNRLKKFSEKIDSKIDFVVNQKIQTYTIKNKSKFYAIFNFVFSDEFIWIMFKETIERELNYEDWLDNTLEIMRIQTDNYLVESQNYFKIELNNEFSESLDKVKQEMRFLENNRTLFAEFTQQVNQCKISIQNELVMIADWFINVDSKLESTLDIQTILETSIEHINTINPNFQLNPKIECKANSLLVFGLSFIEIFRILLGNIIKHSKLQPNELDILISTFDTKQSLTIKVKNNFSNNTSIEKLGKILSEIKESWGQKESQNVNEEGGTGYSKIKRILNFEMGSYGNNFDYTIENNTLEVSLELKLIFKEIEQ